MKKIILLCLFISAILFCGWGVRASVMAGETLYETVTVEAHDTLWDIAAKKVDDTVDIREYMYEVKELNHLQDAGALHPGQKLKLPVVVSSKD